MIGRPGSGRARKASISFPRSATTKLLSSFPMCNCTSADTRLRVDPESGDCSARFRVRAGARPGMTAVLSPGDEERRQPGLDIFRDLLSSAILGVSAGTGAGEALQLAGDVVGHAGERGPGHDRFVPSGLA